MILVISSKKTYSAKRLQEEAGALKQELRAMSVADLVACNFEPGFKFNVLYIRDPYLNGSPKYLAKLVKFAKIAQKNGKTVVDANITKGKIGLGKWYDYQELKKAKINIPHTVIASASEAISVLNGLPRPARGRTRNDTARRYPFVLKWTYGMGGKGVYLINEQIPNSTRLQSLVAPVNGGQELQKILQSHLRQEWMIQEYIDADFEYKVICVGYKALPYILKIKFNKKTGRPDFDSVSRLSPEGEGRVRGNNKLKKLIEVAERASKVLGRELSKVDILEKDGKFYVLEVNRFPGLEGFEKLSKRNVYGKFVEYLVK